MILKKTADIESRDANQDDGSSHQALNGLNALSDDESFKFDALNLSMDKMGFQEEQSHAQTLTAVDGVEGHPLTLFSLNKAADN